MMMLITYDVSVSTSAGRRRLRQISKTCVDFGMRVQYSVFECNVTPAQWVTLKAKLLDLYNENEDSLRFYRLGSKWQNKVQHFGVKKSVDVLESVLIV